MSKPPTETLSVVAKRTSRKSAKVAKKQECERRASDNNHEEGQKRGRGRDADIFVYELS